MTINFFNKPFSITERNESFNTEIEFNYKGIDGIIETGESNFLIDSDGLYILDSDSNNLKVR